MSRYDTWDLSHPTLPPAIRCLFCGYSIEQQDTDLWERPGFAPASAAARHCYESPSHLHQPRSAS